MSVNTIDAGLQNTDVEERKKHLIKQLHNLEIYYTTDGRKLEEVSLYTLEWTHIEMRNEVGRAYGDNYS